MTEPLRSREPDKERSHSSFMKELVPADGVFKHSPSWIVGGTKLDDIDLAQDAWNSAGLGYIFFEVLPPELNVDDNGKRLETETRLIIMDLTSPNNDLTEFLQLIDMVTEERKRVEASEAFQDDPDKALMDHIFKLAKVKAKAKNNLR